MKGCYLTPRTNDVTSSQVSRMRHSYLSVERFLWTKVLSVDRKMLSKQLKSLELTLKRETKIERKTSWEKCTFKIRPKLRKRKIKVLPKTSS